MNFTCESDDKNLGSQVWLETFCRDPCTLSGLSPPFSPNLSLYIARSALLKTQRSKDDVLGFRSPDFHTLL